MNALLVALVLTASTPAQKLALLPLPPGSGASEQVSQAITDALAAELRKAGAQLMTQQELTAVVSIERQKQLLGCAESSCMLEIAGALDVDGVAVGSLARLGESWLLSVQIVDAKKGVTRAHASRRIKGGFDALLDELPQVARELLGPGAVHAVAPTASSSVTFASPVKPLPPPHAEIPHSIAPGERAKLRWVTDGKGHYLAVPSTHVLSGPLFFGTENALYAQRLFGGSSEGDIAFSLSFWDPRARVPADASFALRDGKYTLSCGERQFAFEPVSKKQQAALNRKTRLLDVRWTRFAYALARDDDGHYFFVDKAREPADNMDLRLYVGSTGKMSGHVVEVLAHDDSGDVFRAAGGKLKLDLRKAKAEWTSAGGRVDLTVLPIEDHARFAYSQLGAYAGLELGTPCDLAF